MDDALLARCHASSEYSYLAFAPPGDPSAVYDTPELLLVSTGSADSLRNPAHARRPPTEPAATIALVREFYDGKRLPWCLIAYPDAQAALEPAARDAGLLDEGRFPGMLLARLEGVERPLPNQVRVSRVDTVEELAIWEETFARAYGTSVAPTDPEALQLRGISYFLGYLGDQPVATDMLVAHQGVAGIAAVGTIPSARNHGVGEAVVRHSVAAGRAGGCEVSYLWATPRGVPLYHKIGYEPTLEYRIWTDPQAPLPRDIRPGVTG